MLHTKRCTITQSQTNNGRQRLPAGKRRGRHTGDEVSVHRASIQEGGDALAGRRSVSSTPYHRGPISSDAAVANSSE